MSINARKLSTNLLTLPLSGAPLTMSFVNMWWFPEVLYPCSFSLLIEFQFNKITFAPSRRYANNERPLHRAFIFQNTKKIHRMRIEKQRFWLLAQLRVMNQWSEVHLIDTYYVLCMSLRLALSYLATPPNNGLLQTFTWFKYMFAKLCSFSVSSQGLTAWGHCAVMVRLSEVTRHQYTHEQGREIRIIEIRIKETCSSANSVFAFTEKALAG